MVFGSLGSLTNNRLVKVMFRRFMNFIGSSRQTTFSTGVLDDFGDQTRPASLMRCANSAARVAVKVLVEEDVIAEIGIMVHFAVKTVVSTFTIFIAEEDVAESLRSERGKPVGCYVLKFSGDAKERHLVSTAGGTFDLEVVAVIHPEALETFDEEEIDSYDE